MSYNIVRYVGPEDFGAIIVEGLSRAEAMRVAAEMNASAEPGTMFSIEMWS